VTYTEETMAVRGGEAEAKGDVEELSELGVEPGEEDQGKTEDEDENQDRDQDRYRHHGNTKDEDKVTVEVFSVYLPYVHTLSSINGRFRLLLKAISLHSSAQDLDLNVAIGDTPSEAAVALLWHGELLDMAVRVPPDEECPVATCIEVYICSASHTKCTLPIMSARSSNHMASTPSMSARDRRAASPSCSPSTTPSRPSN
jgi:hypothetical protein